MSESSSHPDKDGESDKTFVDRLSLKPFDAWQRPDLLRLHAIAMLATNDSPPSHALPKRPCKGEYDNLDAWRCSCGATDPSECEIPFGQVAASAPSTTPRITERQAWADFDEAYIAKFGPINSTDAMYISMRASWAAAAARYSAASAIAPNPDALLDAEFMEKILDYRYSNEWVGIALRARIARAPIVPTDGGAKT